MSKNVLRNDLQQSKIQKLIINEARDKNVSLIGKIFKGKAKRFSNMMNINNFSTSSDWLSRFKKRNGLKWKCLIGNAAEVDVTAASEWIEQH